MQWYRGLSRSVLAYTILYPSANLAQQSIEYGKGNVDWKESARFLVYGGLIHAPIVHSWMHFAVKWFPGTSIKALLVKVCADQVLFAPVALSSFYIGLTALEGHSAEEIYAEWNKKFPKTWATGACVWPFIQAFNFRFVAAQNRPVFVGVCSFFWTTLLSSWKMKH